MTLSTETWKRAVELETEIMLERYHMQFSRGLISFALGVVFALITITAQLNHFALISYVSGSLTLACFLFYLILRIRADKKRQELILYKTLMSHFNTWPDPDNPETDIPE
jgi:O-antigen/teichoic acid export membrane protein